MKLYLISHSEQLGYDTYNSAVVAAPNKEIARCISPSDGKIIKEWKVKFPSWCTNKNAVKVMYLGEASKGIKQGVICASFKSC